MEKKIWIFGWWTFSSNNDENDGVKFFLVKFMFGVFIFFLRKNEKKENPWENLWIIILSFLMDFLRCFVSVKKNFHRSNLIGFVMDIEKLKMEFLVSNEIKVFIFDSVLFTMFYMWFYFVVVVDRIASLLWSMRIWKFVQRERQILFFAHL